MNLIKESCYSTSSDTHAIVQSDTASVDDPKSRLYTRQIVLHSGGGGGALFSHF